MPATHLAEPAAPRGDNVASLCAVFVFSFSLGIGFFALPLAAVAAGYDAATVGWLTASSAVSQLISRLSLSWLLGRVSDRMLISAAGISIAASYGLLLVSPALPAFLIVQLLQGSSRALFWTAIQTHAVRSSQTPVKALSYVGGVGSVGQIFGPVATGLLATTSLAAPLVAGAAAGLATTAIASLLIALPVYRRSEGGKLRIWRRSGIDVACWAGFVGGGWRALMASYVPLVLVGAGLTSAITGLLMSLADVTGTVTVFAMARVKAASVERLLVIAVGTTCITLALLPLGAASPVVAAVLLGISGAGGALLAAMSSVVARLHARIEEEGEAITLVGAFRAAALLVTPAGVAIVVGAVAIGPALAVASMLLGLPTLVLAATRLRPVATPEPRA